jgi:hypothetical protein
VVRDDVEDDVEARLAEPAELDLVDPERACSDGARYRWLTPRSRR